MKYASKNDIKQLIPKPESSKAISIFIPTHRISLPHNLKADRVRMKNAIRDIVAKLEKEKVSKEDIEKYVSGLHKLHKDQDFWKFRDNGLAIYAQKDKAVYFDLPIEIDTSVHIGDDFIISPLLAAQKDNYSYLLLELNHNEPRLFTASQSGIERILEKEIPGTLENALKIDEYQSHLQHSTSRGGSRDATHHGHGGGKDNSDKDVKKYYRIIDNVMWDKLLKNSNLPMVIAGDKHSADMFCKQSKYSNACTERLEGNYEHLSENELHEKSWAIMCKHIESQENLFKKIFNKAANRDSRQALITGEHIKKAAKQGRVATLAISIVQRTYDSVVRRMEQRFKIALPSSKRQLVNIEDAAREVLKTGGEITSMLYASDKDNKSYIQAITR